MSLKRILYYIITTTFAVLIITGIDNVVNLSTVTVIILGFTFGNVSQQILDLIERVRTHGQYDD